MFEGSDYIPDFPAGATINYFVTPACPPDATEMARRGARYLRMSLAELAQADTSAGEAYKKLRGVFRWMGKDDIIGFIARVEQGQKDPDPRLERIASILRRQLDGRRDRIRAYGKHWLQHFYENYFPHIWREPGRVESWVRSMYGRRPIAGKKSFLKTRTIPTFREGIEKGLLPVSWNPVDMVLLKLHEMDKFIMFQDLLQRGRKAGIFRFKYVRSAMPDGMERLNDYAFKVFLPPEITIKEAYDQILVEQMMGVAERLGIDAKRVMKMRGQRWGYAQKPDVVRTKFGSPESVLIHEIGHVLGFKYGVYDLLRRKGEGTTRQIRRGKRKGQSQFVPTREAVEHRKLIDAEWRALADARLEGLDVAPNSAAQKYVRKSAEKEAVLLEALIHAPKKFQEVAPNLYETFREFLESDPDLQPLLDVQHSLVMGASEGTVKIPGVTQLGEWIAPRDIARLINNHLSPGLRQNRNRTVANTYNLARHAGNLMNMVQLGVSGFHGINVTTDMMASAVGQGARQLLTPGQRLQGVGRLVGVPVAPLEAIWRGSRLRRAYRQQLDTITDPKMKRMVELVIAAGGRANMDPVYYNQAFDRIHMAIDTIRHDPVVRKLQAAIGLPLDFVGALAETISWPLMQWYVPTGKMGLFSIMAEHEMERHRTGQITSEQLWERLTSSWDSVDNRMGQVVYDNLFWNKTFKDVSMLAVRSVGWNLGSWREYGGIPVDILTTRARLRRGDIWLSQKMGYGMGAVIIYSIIGAIVMYVLTGKRPQELKDYFFPKTGRKDADGNDERLSFPTYAKDWYAYADNPGRTLQNKLHPMWSAMADLAKNQTFEGTEIRDPDDPAFQQIKDVVKYVGSQFLPISIQRYLEMQRTEGAARKNFAIAITGIQPAPKYITRTPAQKLMSSILAARIPDVARSQEDAERSRYRKEMVRKLRTGKAVDEAEARSVLGDAVYREALAESKLTSFTVNYGRLALNEALDVYMVASESERGQILDTLLSKYANAQIIDPDERTAFKTLIEHAPAGTDVNAALVKAIAASTYAQKYTDADGIEHAAGEPHAGHEEAVADLQAEYQRRTGQAGSGKVVAEAREEMSLERRRETWSRRLPNMTDAQLQKALSDRTYRSVVGPNRSTNYEVHLPGDPHAGEEEVVGWIQAEIERRRKGNQ